MELKYVVLTIIKIIISVPTMILYESTIVNGAVLMGGHLDNKNNATNITEGLIDDYDFYDEKDMNFTILSNNASSLNEELGISKGNSEEIPNPSPLVLPGYNLPENIFNKGKPFYLEKDPLTGKIDFSNKATPTNDEDLYEYLEDEPSEDIYDKANINRKDGSLSSHKPNDVNQLTPNFHDFLNLPIKYNSNKYVYPLISNSYANTKIQGNVNKFHNHKDYNTKTSTYKPTGSPTYFGTSTNHHLYGPPKTSTTTSTSTKATTTTEKIYLTSNTPNLMNSGMNHPSFHEEFEDYYDSTSNKPSEIFLTTKNINNIYLTTKAPTTTSKKTMSLFEQLFGDYDEVVTTTTEKIKPPSLFLNIPSNKNKYESTPTNHMHHTNSHTNVLSGSNMGFEQNSYEYEDEYGSEESTVKEKPKVTTVDNYKHSTTTTTTTTEKTLSSTNKSIEKEKVKEKEVDESDVNLITTIEVTTTKVTSLPLGENHLSNLNNRQPIIVATQNLREKLNSEKVLPKPFGFDKPPSTSNIHIAPDQDTVSFVVGHHQNVDGGQYVGTALKESPYDSNPFKPFYGQQIEYNMENGGYIVQSTQSYPDVASSVTIQPQKNSEASLAIGVPVSGIKQIPGQVVDEKLEISDEPEFSQGTKVVFPEDKEPNLVPPPQPLPPLPNREVLKLSSKPMYHQLPSDLTPPKEKDVIPSRLDRPRPPWDPRPGHFHSGKPEYVRPPRPPQEVSYKRIDSLPNILPQFRPNMKPHYLSRQPLLDRPSNRPIGFFEKLLPPPPPKNLHNLRKIPPPSQNLEQLRPAEDRIINEAPKKPVHDQFSFYKVPPKVLLPNRRIGDVEGDVETLQMIQAKQSGLIQEQITENMKENNTEKPLYVVYPVNTPPIKMDVIDTNKKESVVIGTRAEKPLPPSKINDFKYEQNPIFNSKDRNDSPVLKPHPRPSTFPIKSDFPYPLERPDPSVLNPAVPESPTGNNLDVIEELPGGNQWNTIESRISTGNHNQISATLKTYTEKPIAVAYTPTEPQYHDQDKYSMPNYGGSVIPEIRPGTVDNVDVGPNNEFTVSAVMHTHPQIELGTPPKDKDIHKDQDTSYDFQAPFQASVNVDALNQGWSVVRDKNKSTTEATEDEVTTLPLATTSEFDIENFKPQLIGGFKPIYDFPDDSKVKETEINERQEK